MSGKETVVYIYFEIIFSLRKISCHLLTTWISLEYIILGEIKQTQEKKKKLYDFTYMWNLKNLSMEVGSLLPGMGK